MNQKNKLFLVLCLHRSGSSATAGIMHTLGIHMGRRLLGADWSNQKGHFENWHFKELNDQILKSMGGSWYNPPAHEKLMQANFPVWKLRQFVSLHAKPVWGLKDPRTLLTFALWKPYLEETSDITYIFVHRPFESSVRSLAYRNRLSMNQAETILTPYLKNFQHYRNLLQTKNQDIIDVYFEDLLKNPEWFVSEINRRISNDCYHRMDEVKNFLDCKLKKF